MASMIVNTQTNGRSLWSLILRTLLLCSVVVTASACEEPVEEDRFRMKFNNVAFDLEIANTFDTRMKGLGDREEIEPDGGMVFIFPAAEKEVQHFVMRDCKTDIDILFLDDGGRIVAWHEMKMEEPKRDGESDVAYESRLKRYSSKFPVRIAVELAPGKLQELRDGGLRKGQKVECDLDALKAMAK